MTLLDLSRPMLDRAVERIGQLSSARPAAVTVLQGDIRELPLPPAAFDIVLAAATLHHLRTDDEWRAVFQELFHSLRPGGSFWISDLVEHDRTEVQLLMWQRYGDYLTALGGEEYRHKVFAYIDQEDTPRSLTFQLDLLRSVGFAPVDVLHKTSCFAAFGGVKPKG